MIIEVGLMYWIGFMAARLLGWGVRESVLAGGIHHLCYEVEDILATAVIGFSACRVESGSTETIVHTGNWGTGAFGGDKPAARRY